MVPPTLLSLLFLEVKWYFFLPALSFTINFHQKKKRIPQNICLNCTRLFCFRKEAYATVQYVHPEILLAMKNFVNNRLLDKKIHSFHILQIFFFLFFWERTMIYIDNRICICSSYYATISFSDQRNGEHHSQLLERNTLRASTNGSIYQRCKKYL